MGQQHSEKDESDDNLSSSQPRTNTDDIKKPQPNMPFLSGNFRNYMKLKQQHNGDDSRQDDSNDEQEEKQWNHFTTPLKPTPQHNTDQQQEAQTKDTTYNPHTKSVFSDLERTQTVDKFGHIFMNRMGDVMTSGKLSAAWGQQDSPSTSLISLLYTDYSPNATRQRERSDSAKTKINPKDYAAERRLMQPHFTPFVWGATCGAITLVSMRLGRWHQARTTTLGKSNSAFNSNSNGSLLNSPNYASTMTSKNTLQDMRRSKPPQSYGNYNNNRPSNNQLSSLSTVPVDLAISLLVGISTSIFLTRPDDLLKDFAKTPLLQGKSVLSEELCQPFSQEMYRINQGYHVYNAPSIDNSTEKQVISFQELWKDDNIGELESLKAIRDFVVNCHKREHIIEETKAHHVGSDGEEKNEL
ncbi:hypothetical protein ACHAWC_006837 [Mediolabrus comicus]